MRKIEIAYSMVQTGKLSREIMLDAGDKLYAMLVYNSSIDKNPTYRIYENSEIVKYTSYKNAIQDINGEIQLQTKKYVRDRIDYMICMPGIGMVLVSNLMAFVFNLYEYDKDGSIIVDQVNHKDTDSENNELSNLEVIDELTNKLHGMLYRHFLKYGLIEEGTKITASGLMEYHIKAGKARASMEKAFELLINRGMVE